MRSTFLNYWSLRKLKQGYLGIACKENLDHLAGHPNGNVTMLCYLLGYVLSNEGKLPILFQS